MAKRKKKEERETKVIKIKVSEQDILRGNPYSSTNCPINLAARKKFNDEISITATSLYYRETTIDVAKDTTLKILKEVKLPESVVKFNKLYDRYGAYGPTGNGIEPFEFEIEVEKSAIKTNKRCK